MGRKDVAREFGIARNERSNRIARKLLLRLVIGLFFEQHGGKAQSRQIARLVIPGMVSRMSGKLNELTEMKVTVGSRESSGIPKMMRTLSQ